MGAAAALLVALLAATAAEAARGRPRNHQDSMSTSLAEAGREVSAWTPCSGVSPWELSQLEEGDIMQTVTANQSLKWKNNRLPFKIERKDFTREEAEKIEAAARELNSMSCLRVHPVAHFEEDYVRVTGNATGCWSERVGRRGGEQRINLHPPNCLELGTIYHEFMHAIGFYHTHNSPHRDEFIRILWENVNNGALGLDMGTRTVMGVGCLRKEELKDELRIRGQPEDGDVGELSSRMRGAMSLPVEVTADLSSMAAVQKVTDTTATDLATLLDAGDDAVVTLVAGDTCLVAHRAVLMDRSPVFAAMFAHDTLEASSGQVAIADVEGPVLRQLVSYLYTLRAPQLPDMATQLLAAADKYGVSGLKAACEQQVAAQLTVETAAGAAVLAIRHSCTDLRKAAVTFVKDNLDHVLGTQGWADAMLSQPRDLVKVSRLVSLEPPAEIRSLPAKEKDRRLIQVAKEGAVEKLEALLAAGADVAATDRETETALHWAAAKGHLEVARRLLAWGAPVDARGSMDMMPMHWAAVNGDAAVVRLLLAASADHSARDCEGWTPLHWAADNGKPEVAAALLEAGADRGATNNEGRTPLDVAGEENHQQLVDLLSGS